MMRLDRFLCEAGFGTRSQVKELVRKGQVTVNGLEAKNPEQKIEEGKDAVVCRGRAVEYKKFEYFMLHKPAGTVSATKDKRQKTVLDLFEGEASLNGLFPVGRLDKDTEGLLLLTNDGELAHGLLSPKRHVDKVYFARVEGTVGQVQVERFAQGVEIGEKRPTLPAKLEILESGEISEVRITICEGKHHQIKRMFEAVGCRVLYLKRLSMGPIMLDARLRPGEYRPLTEEEIQKLTIGKPPMPSSDKRKTERDFHG